MPLNLLPFRSPTKSNLERPKRLRDWPSYLRRLLGGFFKRLFYIVRLVYETNPWLLYLMAFFCLANGLLPVLGAWITKDLLNAVAALLGTPVGEAPPIGEFLRECFTGCFKNVTFLLVFQFVYLFLNRLLGRLSALTNNLSGELLINHIKLKIMGKAKSVDMASFDRPSFYEKLENANREAGQRPLSILRASFDMISALISAVSFIVILFSLHPLAPLIIVLMSLPGAIVNCVFRNRSFRYVRRHSKERRKMEYFSSQLVDKDKAKEVRVMGLSDTFTERYSEAFRTYYGGVKRLVFSETRWQLFTVFLSLLANAVLLFYVVYRVLYAGGEIGDYSLYTGALTSIGTYVGTMIASLATIYEGTLFIDNMIVFMDEEIGIIPSASPALIPSVEGPHTIEFRSVSFRYPGSDRYVLRDISFTLKTSETVVLVGLNGAGKTTLIKLLTRLYDPTEGQILLDGRPISDYDVPSLYRLFGVIFQDFGRYAVTAGENIAFGDINAPLSAEKIEEAACRGGADAFIRALPDGYATPLQRYFEENGIELSGGQWQKLSIARAFYKHSAVLILDEPTASLDPLAEDAVFEQFAKSGKDKITLLVSHRLSGATVANKIIVLEEGQLIEYGTHEELIGKGGRYYTLFTTQARHYREKTAKKRRSRRKL